MVNLIKVGIVGFLLLYPVLIYFGLKTFSPSQLGLFFLVLFAIRIIFAKTKSKTARWQLIFTVAIGGTLAALTWFFNTKEYLLWYPVGLNIAFFLFIERPTEIADTAFSGEGQVGLLPGRPRRPAGTGRQDRRSPK